MHEFLRLTASRRRRFSGNLGSARNDVRGIETRIDRVKATRASCRASECVVTLGGLDFGRDGSDVQCFDKNKGPWPGNPCQGLIRHWRIGGRPVVLGSKQALGRLLPSRASRRFPRRWIPSETTPECHHWPSEKCLRKSPRTSFHAEPNLPTDFRFNSDPSSPGRPRPCSTLRFLGRIRIHIRIHRISHCNRLCRNLSSFRGD